MHMHRGFDSLNDVSEHPADRTLRTSAVTMSTTLNVCYNMFAIKQNMCYLQTNNTKYMTETKTTNHISTYEGRSKSS